MVDVSDCNMFKSLIEEVCGLYQFSKYQKIERLKGRENIISCFYYLVAFPAHNGAIDDKEKIGGKFIPIKLRYKSEMYCIQVC